MGLALPCPDHTTLSRRNATVTIRRQLDDAPQGPVSVIVDSTGLQVCGEGEWHAQKHGEKKVKRWKKARKTNHIERFNNTLRQRLSRLVRDTLSFSKKVENHIGAIKFFICHYNLEKAV
jgi:hypothetical protein